MIQTVRAHGTIGMDTAHAEALAAFRAFNYETIYLRSASRQQASAVVGMLRALVEYYGVHPTLIPDVAERVESLASDVALHDAVEYVAGMTDRYACRSAVTHLDWPIDQLPNGIDR
jgi:dGTPase